VSLRQAGGLAWPRILDRLIRGEDLDEDLAAEVMSAIMGGAAEPEQVAGFLVALRAKGEAATEVAGFVRAMIAAATEVPLTEELRARTVDVVGTGGDGADTFNVSTIAAVVVAAAGQPVAKHGNRAASSACGSADLLEGWGIELEMRPTDVAGCIEDLGIGFLFARTFHPAMRVVAPVRAHLGIRTVFNVLGPLSNPAHAPAMAVGVADARLAAVMADALARLGRRHVLLFRGEDGLDELTTTGRSQLWEVRDGEVHTSGLDPRDLGIERASPEDLTGGDVATNVAIGDAILGGEPGPRRDIVLLNAAAGLYAADAVDDLQTGIVRAAEAIDSGAAEDLKRRWVERCTELKGDDRG
jgi:anthranilate phosphoribosyltransferase